jgi:hypothetical protein
MPLALPLDESHGHGIYEKRVFFLNHMIDIYGIRTRAWIRACQKPP